MRLQNKIIVITGGDSGIGIACSNLFIAEGATVIIMSNNSSTLEKVKHKFNEPCLEVDIRDYDSLKNCFQKIGKKHRKIDVLVANAGICKVNNINKYDATLLNNIIDTNIKGTYNTVAACIPYLNNPASIILMASNSQLLAVPNFSIYSATKAAIRSFAKTMSTDLLANGIRVNSLSPGATDTRLLENMGIPSDQYNQFKKVLAEGIPMQRIAEVNDIAKAALFLASDDSNYITGIDLVVDGGHSQAYY